MCDERIKGEAHVWKKIWASWGLNPRPSDYQSDALSSGKNNGSDNIKMMEVYKKLVCPSKLKLSPFPKPHNEYEIPFICDYICIKSECNYRCKHSLFSQKIKFKSRKSNTSCTLKIIIQQYIINSYIMKSTNLWSQLLSLCFWFVFMCFKYSNYPLCINKIKSSFVVTCQV